MAALLPLLAACYDEQDGNDFDTVMDEVSIVIPETAYSGSLGSTIAIEPKIATGIAEEDLEYFWEVNGARFNSHGRKFFTSLVDDEAQGRTLNYVCHLDSNVVSLNTNYQCRLRIHQKSTGRNFYPESNFTITIQGITGLLVLYGDDTASDVGVLEADEFMPSSSSLPESPKATMGMFSMNTGRQLTGKGKAVVQICNDYLSGDDQKNNCRINVMTDKEAVWLNRNDLSLWGTWDDAFYLQGDKKLNANDPKGYIVEDMNAYAFDGSNLFINKPIYTFQYLFPTFTPETATGGGDKFILQPFVNHFNSDGGIQLLLYADAVNGDRSRKGFVGTTSYVDHMVRDARLIDTGNDNALFNPGDMKADLVQWNDDSRKHVIAVMRGTAEHPQYAGQYFFVDINPLAPAAGESAYQGVPQVIAPMSGMPGIDNAIAFTFASTQNEYYYATSTDVYHYGLDGQALAPAQKLCMADGSAITFDGEVTMMKLLDSPAVTTHNTDEVLLVATWNGASSTLYALHLDSMTGNVTTVSKYNKDNVTDWQFGKIRDVNIKSL